MATQIKPALLIDGKEHRDWSSFEIDSDLMVPADAWHFSIGPEAAELPQFVTEGKEVQVRMADQIVMLGRIDSITHEVSRQGQTVSIAGRDGAAALLDCSTPIFVERQISLAEVVAKVVRPLGISKIRIDADKTVIRDKINVEPGETAWDTLKNAAEANGLWPWFAPDGTLVVGRPDYTQSPVATLLLKRDGKSSNVVHLSETRDMSKRYSDVSVLGQAHGTEREYGKHNLRGAQKDTGVGWFRPKIIMDNEADNAGIAEVRARKFIADARLEGYTLQAEVNGYVVDPNAKTPLFWAPGQRVHLVSEPHGLDDVFFLMARKFSGGRGSPARTLLTLKEDQVWQPEAHPHKHKHRRGRNRTPGAVRGAVIDVSGGTP